MNRIESKPTNVNVAEILRLQAGDPAEALTDLCIASLSDEIKESPKFDRRDIENVIGEMLSELDDELDVTVVAKWIEEFSGSEFAIINGSLQCVYEDPDHSWGYDDETDREILAPGLCIYSVRAALEGDFEHIDYVFRKDLDGEWEKTDNWGEVSRPEIIGL